MKKILVVLVLYAATTQARTTQSDIDQMNSYNPIDEIQQVQRNREMLRQQQLPRFQCYFTTTNEKTGKIKKNIAYGFEQTDSVEFIDSEKQYMYYEESREGESIVGYVDKKTHDASITVNDANGNATLTGYAKGCTKV